MRKFLSGAALSATIFAANMAPVFANAATDLKTGNGVTVNSVAPKSSLIEIEGRTLTDSEAAMIEGEGAFVIAPAVFLTLLKMAAASATKKAVIGVGWFALTGTLKAGRFVVTNSSGQIIGAIALAQAVRNGWIPRSWVGL